ncbi:hypothetical protein Tco_0026816 [Tanacetum coccineum]
MMYPPLRPEGLPFDLEWDLLPNYTIRSLNSFEWRKIIFGTITSMGIRHAKTYTLRGRSSTKLGQSEDYDEEREMEPRLEPYREVTPTLRPRSPIVRRQRERVMGFEEASNREATNLRLTWGGNLPPNDTLLSHHAQPFIPSSLHTLTGLVPIHVNPYSQPSAGLVNGQTLNFLFQTQIGNPLARGTSTYHPQGGYIPQAFTNNGVPSYNRSMYPTVTPSSNYPFYTQPMYPPPNMLVYPNPAGSFANSTGSVTSFVRWIEDYPLPDGLKMPSHIGSYDGKRDQIISCTFLKGPSACRNG